jgi:hypothetical protein
MFVSRRFANCVYAALQPIPSFTSAGPPHAYRYAGIECMPGIFSLRYFTIKKKSLQSLDSPRFIIQSHKKNA